MNDERRDVESPTRRRVVTAAGAAGFLAGAPNLVGGQETPTEGETPETATPEADDVAETVVLGGRVDYWLGLAPEAIEGEENPTLELAEGESYRVVWINLDGAEHELKVEDADGEERFESDSNEEVGATASVTVEAGTELAEYYCEYHPDSMRGSVELGEGLATGTPTPTGTPTDAGTATPEEDTPEY